VYSDEFERTIAAMGLTILKTPVRAPRANAFCERVIGTIRRECLDWMIPDPILTTHSVRFLYEASRK
jgi:transposase InsO family protein